MSRGGSRNSVVLTKYGERPLIDMPPLSLSRSSGGNEDVPAHIFRVPGKRATHVYHQPPRSPQVSLTAPQHQRKQYQEPQMEYPDSYQRHQGQNRNYYQPQYPVQYQTQAPPPQSLPPPPQAQPQVRQSYFSNLAPDSNVIPYNYTHYRPQPQMPQSEPQYNTSQTYAPAPAPERVPNGTQSNEVHVYYGPNGERLPGPLPPPSYPTDFTLEGTLEFGKLVSVKVRHSNISYREIPDFVFRDLHKTYGMIERVDVKIVAQGGEYNIYASPSIQSDVSNNPGYIFEQEHARQIPIPAFSQPEIHDNRRRDSHDPYTRIYRYGKEGHHSMSLRGSSGLYDIDEDRDRESQPMTRDSRRF